MKEDQQLVERLQSLNQLSKTKESLSRISGIKNDQVLQKLIDLDVGPHLVASLAIIPLLQVAWADGKVDEKERSAILAAAESEGIRQKNIDYDLLNAWLARRPEPKLLEAWKHYIAGLCAALTPEECSDLKLGLLQRARLIAEASGGFLGLGDKISRAEAKMLHTLEESFASCP